MIYTNDAPKQATTRTLTSFSVIEDKSSKTQAAAVPGVPKDAWSTPPTLGGDRTSSDEPDKPNKGRPNSRKKTTKRETKPAGLRTRLDSKSSTQEQTNIKSLPAEQMLPNEDWVTTTFKLTTRDHILLDRIKLRAIEFRIAVEDGEVIRAAWRHLHALSDTDLRNLLQNSQGATKRKR